MCRRRNLPRARTRGADCAEARALTHQLAGRFSPRRGNFGILVCRTIADKATFAARCRDTADDGRGYIIGIDDDDLATLVQACAAGGEDDPLRLLRGRFNALVN